MLAAVAVVAVAAVLLASSGEDPTVEPAAAAARVAGILEESFGVAPDVRCPDGVTARDGERFTCTARASGERLAITVELLGEDGRFRIAGISSGSPEP